MVFAVTRAFALLAGMHYLSNEPYFLIQLLDMDLLQHHLLRGLLHLHAQPPLFNALIGIAEKLAGTSYGTVMLSLQLLLGLAGALSVYLALVELGVAPRFSLVVSLLLLLNPAEILFEFDALYTSMVTALNCFIALALVYYIKRRSGRWLYLMLALAVSLTLLRSTYHWIWLVELLAVLAWYLPECRIQIARAGSIALFFALLWPAKNLLLFHHFQSTTWGPYNISRHWGDPPFPPPVQRWIDQGQLPTLTLPSDEAEAEWLHQYWLTPPAGSPELDDLSKHTGGTVNWNSLAMLRMHDAQAKDVAFLLRHDPKLYLHNAALSLVFYFEPATAYFTQTETVPMWYAATAQYQKIAPLDRALSRVCCNVFGFPPASVGPAPTRGAALTLRIHSLCLGAILLFVLACAALLSLRLRPSLWTGSRDRKVTILVLSATIFYLFTVVTIMEIGENMRFRFETHALVLMVIAIFLQQLWDHRHAPNS